MEAARGRAPMTFDEERDVEEDIRHWPNWEDMRNGHSLGGHRPFADFSRNC